MANYNSAYTGAQIDAAVGAVASKANDSDVVHNTGNETIGGVKTFSSFPVTPSSTPTTNYQVANKKYIDDKVKTDVPVNAKFTDTTYSEITISEIDAGTASTLRTITGRRIKYILDKVQAWLDNKVDKVSGKGLSTNDYTTAEKNKLAGIATGATKNSTDAILLNRANHTGTQSADTITDGTTNKVFTATEKTKLANIESGANKYTHPATHPASMITDLPTGKKVARFVVGASTSGWTEKDCDYLCDGTNDQEEINNAITALPATGGEVVILDGTYNITESINIPKDNVSIRGNGDATTLKRMYNSTGTDSGATARGLITLNGKSGCKIQGLKIDGNKATYTATNNYGINLASSSNNNTVIGNTCDNNNGHGISLYSSSNNNTVIGNACNNNNSGIYLYSSSYNTAIGNTCDNNSNGIRIYSSSNNNAITGNTHNNNSYGIYLDSSSYNTVTSNACNNNNSDGIHLYSSSNNIITGNTCIRGAGQTDDYTSNQYTIRLRGSANSYNLISSNNCMGKAVAVGGGTGNSAWGNKFDNTDDLP